MFDNIKNNIEARIELIKLDFINKSSSVLSKLIGLCVLVSVAIMCGTTMLLLLAILMGYLMSNYLLGFTIFLGVVFLITIILIIGRKKLIIKPLKNLFIEYIYDEFTKD